MGVPKTRTLIGLGLLCALLGSVVGQECSQLWGANFTCCMLLQRNFYGSAETWSKHYYRNQTIVLAPDPDGSAAGCNLPPEGYDGTNKVILVGPGLCTIARSLTLLTQMNAIAGLNPLLSDFGTSWVDDAYRFDLTVPFFGCHLYDINEPYSPGFYAEPANVFALFFTLENQTIYFAPPVQNQYWQDWNTLASGTQFVFAVGMLVNQFLIVVAMVKLVFFISQRGWKFHIPQLTIMFCVCVGIMGTFLAIAGFQAWRSWAGFWVLLFFAGWSIFFCMTANLLVGLYFSEVAILQRLTVPGLNKLFWPSIVIMAIVWVFILLQSILRADAWFYYTVTAPQTSIYLMQFAFIEVGLIVQFLVTIYGGGFLMFRFCRNWATVKTIKLAAKQRGMLLSILRPFGSAVLIFAFGTWYNLYWNYPYTSNVIIDGALTERSYIILMEVTTYIVPGVAALLVVFNFNVRQDRDISKNKHGGSNGSGTRDFERTSRFQSGSAAAVHSKRKEPHTSMSDSDASDSNVSNFSLPANEAGEMVAVEMSEQESQILEQFDRNAISI